MTQTVSARQVREIRRNAIMEHVLKGWRVWQIAEALKVDRSTVYRDIEARLETPAANCPYTNNYRQLLGGPV